MDNNINILDELNKGCCMGIDALDIIIPKVKEATFKELLENQLKDYEEISTKINSTYQEYTEKEIHKTSTMEKAMTWYGIQKDTILDESISNLADLLIKGTNMGIIEGQKIKNNKTMDKKVHKICSDYIKLQEKYVDRLSEFL